MPLAIADVERKANSAYSEVQLHRQQIARLAQVVDECKAQIQDLAALVDQLVTYINNERGGRQ